MGYNLQNLQTVKKIVNGVVSSGKIGKRSKAEIVKHIHMDLLMLLCRRFLQGAEMWPVHFVSGKLIKIKIYYINLL